MDKYLNYLLGNPSRGFEIRERESGVLIPIMVQQVRNEIAVLKKVSMGHQNILTLVDYFETMNNRS